ncbi:MAG: glycosyltransferase family 2 protein [Cyanobacteria bacterium]|nr:glycosyltransferase family 2 protein [Cyanobacteriota bacterium]
MLTLGTDLVPEDVWPVARHIQSKVIVSLTTIRRRIEDIGPTIASILHQSVPADEVLLYVSRSPYLYDEGIAEHEIPSSIRTREKQRRLQVLYTENIGSYRKLIPALRRDRSKECVIITADDDMLYPYDWIEGLSEAYARDRSQVVAYRNRRMMIRDGHWLPYSTWPLITHVDAEAETDSMPLFPTGRDGVLYAPGMFSDLIFDDVFLKLAPYNDDIWFRFMTYINGVGVTAAASKQLGARPFQDRLPSGRKVRLCAQNLDWSATMNNDRQIANVVKYLRRIGKLTA